MSEEPVAYRVDGVLYNDLASAEFAVKQIKRLRKDLNMGNGLIERPPYIEPLYTKEQLQPKVKMTHAEFDEFSQFFRYRKDTTIDNMLKFIAGRRDDGETDNLYKRFCGTGTLEGSIKAQAEFAVLWAVFNPDNPEETIEIIKDKKWLVRSKEQYEPDMDQGIAEGGYLYLMKGDIYSIEYYQPTPFKDEAKYFDTKEEAEKWVTPSTEAVQLPVEDE